MYVSSNPRTKKQLKEQVAAGQRPTVFQPGPFGGREIRAGRCTVEGPHAPQPHAWYAVVDVNDAGEVIRVR